VESTATFHPALDLGGSDGTGRAVSASHPVPALSESLRAGNFEEDAERERDGGPAPSACAPGAIGARAGVTTLPFGIILGWILVGAMILVAGSGMPDHFW
jgi:hypothetical protein